MGPSTHCFVAVSSAEALIRLPWTGSMNFTLSPYIEDSTRQWWSPCRHVIGDYKYLTDQCQWMGELSPREHPFGTLDVMLYWWRWVLMVPVPPCAIALIPSRSYKPRKFKDFLTQLPLLPATVQPCTVHHRTLWYRTFRDKINSSAQCEVNLALSLVNRLITICARPPPAQPAAIHLSGVNPCIPNKVPPLTLH